MYNRFQLASKFVQYYFSASNSRGHGMHSPFVFDFIVHVLNDRTKSPVHSEIEAYRKRLKSDKRTIPVKDFGAGSAVSGGNQRKVSDIARASLKSAKFAGLLYRIAKYFQCKTIVELGTSLGTTTAYLSSAAPEGKVITVEGADSIASIAQEFFQSNGFTNIQLLKGNFDEVIPEIFEEIKKVDLLFIDGNHREDATVEYFELFLPKAGEESIFILDDIHWSRGMENAWERVKNHPSVTLSIDLFFIGLVFFRKEFLEKRDFVIRF